MQETYRSDSIKELAAANRDLAVEQRKTREELQAWRTEIRQDAAMVSDALGGAAQWCGIGLIIGMLTMSLIGKFGGAQK